MGGLRQMTPGQAELLPKARRDKLPPICKPHLKGRRKQSWILSRFLGSILEQEEVKPKQGGLINSPISLRYVRTIHS